MVKGVMAAPLLRTADEDLMTLTAQLTEALSDSPEGVWLEVLDPDISREHFAGERLDVAGKSVRYRPYRVWLELAETLGCGVEIKGRTQHQGVPYRELLFYPLPQSSWHQEKQPGSHANLRGSYGQRASFSRLQKLEEPTFLSDYQRILRGLGLSPKAQILSLGAGRADEWQLLETLYPEHQLNYLGIDLEAEALVEAQRRFSGARFQFLQADINQLDTLGLPPFDLVLAIATLQSPSVKADALLRSVVQNHLTAHATLVVAAPNSRYRGSHLQYGAKMKNFQESDLSLLIRDLAYFRKYLNQHRFNVRISGKYYIFLTATRP